MQSITPEQNLDVLAHWGTDNLTHVIAIDSQSDESSPTIPSTEGQRNLSNFLQKFFGELGYDARQDPQANLIVSIPSNINSATAPSIALMVHMDTSEGTQAVPKLAEVPQWNGQNIVYAENDRLQVSAENYPATQHFVGDDVLHGPGRFPVGLDDKLGMAELMTLAQTLHHNPELPHGDIFLIFRPDEEIGRMEAVLGLAKELKRLGVSHGYTVDGIAPFEINVENFNAARARITFEGKPLNLSSNKTARELNIRIFGVNTHGATAKPEGYLNATVIFSRAMTALSGNSHVIPTAFETNPALECNADLKFLVVGDTNSDIENATSALMNALEAEVGPHSWRGATVELTQTTDVDQSNLSYTDEMVQLTHHLEAFLQSPGPQPLLSEHSESYEGYTNPHMITTRDGQLTLDYRLRDFTESGLASRGAAIEALAKAKDQEAEIVDQYVNMGPVLSEYPELVDWAEQALKFMDIEPIRRPIRGGTGVDPFLEEGIPVANLGTGYFAPESEKELTSRQNIARHSLWLTHLVQIIAKS